MHFRSIFVLSFLAYIQSMRVIDVAFTVKNLSTNEQLKSNFLTMISSLFEHTVIENLRLHVIGDAASLEFVDETLRKLYSYPQINQLNIDDLASKHAEQIISLIGHFSSSHTYYKDPLFFLSPFLHRILPEDISRVIMLDIDLRFEHDIEELYRLFDQFNISQIIGIARENQPVYRHLLWSYRQENLHTLVGSPPPDGLTGFNSGVLLLDLVKIRQSNLFNNYLANSTRIEELLRKYRFHYPHLGDQDFYTLLSFEHGEFFFFLPCYWNRQLCTWWKGKGYDDVWSAYFDCNNEENIRLYHGNCQTTLPEKVIQKKGEL